MSCTCFYHAPEVHGPGGCDLVGCACKWDGKLTLAESRRVIIERLLAAWVAAPELRLGQLIVNSLDFGPSADSAKLFYKRDGDFVVAIEQFAKTGTRPPR
jgi:hypothetical protein